MFTKKFQIKEITCQACVSISNSVLTEIEGVANVVIDFPTGQTTMLADRDIAQEQIVEALRQVDKKAIF